MPTCSLLLQPTSRCPACEGHWISGRAYFDWLDSHGDALPERTYEGPEILIADTQLAKLCPECSRILLRYVVGHGTDFAIDHDNNGVSAVTGSSSRSKCGSAPP